MAKKKLTPADNKFIVEFLNGDNLDFDSNVEIVRRNRFTGEAVEIDPISAAAFDFVMTLEPILYNKEALKRVHPKLSPKNSVSKFDRARMIVSKLNIDAYMRLLD
jgi:hypothetical protein